MAEARATQSVILALVASEGNDQAARSTQSVVLALTDDFSDFARNTQSLFLAHAEHFLWARSTQQVVLAVTEQVPCLAHWAQCWRVERADGTVLAFTSHDRPLEFRGDTYAPCDSLSASASEVAAVLGSVGNMELAGVLADDGIREADLLGGVFDGAAVEVWMVPWIAAVGEAPWRLGAGTVGKTSQGTLGFTAEVLTPGARLQQQPLLQTYTPACRFELGDARCKVDLEALKVAGTATSVAAINAARASSRRQFSDSARTEADGHFDQGILAWTSGANSGARSEVKSYTEADGTFVLWSAMLRPIEAGDGYEVTPGCDLTAATCKDKFDNFVNYGGFPDVPGRDSIIDSPNSKG
jgi:uncharacterized phage protein (TIGR02218 family)